MKNFMTGACNSLKILFLQESQGWSIDTIENFLLAGWFSLYNFPDKSSTFGRFGYYGIENRQIW